MDRLPFIIKAFLGTAFFFFLRVPESEAQEEDGFSMSSGALVGGANGTHGA